MRKETIGRVARIVHAIAATCCLLVFGLVVTRNGAPAGWSQLAILYCLPLLGLLYFMSGMLSAPGRSIDLLLPPVSVGMATLLGEVVATGVAPPSQFEGVAEALLGAPTPSRFEVVRDLRASGVHAYPELSPWVLRGFSSPTRDSLAAFSVAPAPAHATIVSCQEGERSRLVYESDAHGFRSRSGNPADQATTILLVGDSFAFGQCVQEEQTIAGRLRARWPATRNLGVSGAGPLHELAVLREYGSYFRSAVVVWVYYEGNDLNDLKDELNSTALANYLTPGFRLGIPERGEITDRWLSSTLDSIYESRLARELEGGAQSTTVDFDPASILKLTRLRSLFGLGLSNPDATSLGALPEILTMARDDVSGWGGTLVFVYMPDYGRYRPYGGESYAGREELLALTDSLGVETVDLHASFTETLEDPRSMWVHPRGHLSADGYAFVAEAITQEIDGILSSDH